MTWKSNVNPILIGGDGRSGTTLLSVILDSHPQLAVGAELHFRGPPNLGPYMLEANARIKAGEYALTYEGEADHPEWLSARRFFARCKRSGVNRGRLVPLIGAAMAETASDLESFSDRCALIERIGGFLADTAGKPRWGLKIMREIKQIDQYAEVWPNARFIHIVRDGRDAAASQIKEHSSWGYKDIQQAAAGWSSIILRAHELAKEYKVATVRYEDIVLDPEPTLRKLCDEIGVTWDPALLQHTQYHHALIERGGHHPSHSQISRPINASAFGRFMRDLSPEEIAYFNDTAREAMALMGYPEVVELPPDQELPPAAPPIENKKQSELREERESEETDLPVIPVSFTANDPNCKNHKSCRQFRRRSSGRLMPRFVGAHQPHADQVKTAVIEIGELDFDAYIKHVKAKYKGNVIRDARKAEKAGVTCKMFTRDLFVPDIVEINHSKETRSGGKMKENYLRSVEEVGGYPSQYFEYERPKCPVHFDVWWGAFQAVDGYKQGDIVTNEKLIAYINLRRFGDFCSYNFIIGHGDYLQLGVMYHLNFAVMRWLLRRDDPMTQGLRTLFYAGFYQGKEGLQLWKKKTGFMPAYLVTDPEREGIREGVAE